MTPEAALAQMARDADALASLAALFAAPGSCAWQAPSARAAAARELLTRWDALDGLRYAAMVAGNGKLPAALFIDAMERCDAARPALDDAIANLNDGGRGEAGFTSEPRFTPGRAALRDIVYAVCR